MIKALNNYVLIRPDLPKEKELESGIIIPELRKEVPQSGTIIDVGFTERRIADSYAHKVIGQLSQGMKVWFKMWAGQDIEYEREMLKSVHLKDIIAIEVDKTES